VNNISVLAIVYNEEDRIVDFLRSFIWSNDIILIDKSSSDKTVELARNYSAKIIRVPYTEEVAKLAEMGLSIACNEWVLMATASDIMHPNLAKKILGLINKADFDYDVIEMPYSIYVFGIRDKRSPWYTEWENKLAKKKVIKYSNRVHEERGVLSAKKYRMEYSETDILYHLTHRNIDTFFEHHLRYCKLEADKITDETGVRTAFKQILRACKLVFIERKTYKIKKDGMALGLAYISYFIMSYLFIWQKFYAKGEKTYENIKKDILDSSMKCGHKEV